MSAGPANETAASCTAAWIDGGKSLFARFWRVAGAGQKTRKATGNKKGQT